MSAGIDDIIIGILRAGGVDLHDGLVEVNAADNVVTYDLPYAVYYSSVGDDDNRRLSGRRQRRSKFWSITFVGEDRAQAIALGERIRDLLNDKRIPVPGRKTWLCSVQGSQRVRRDDDAIRPDGSPLFYGVDDYAMSHTLAA